MSVTRHALPARRRLLVGAALAVAAPVLAVALAPSGLADSTATAPKSVNVTLRDTAIALSAKTAPSGQVKFVVKNAGKSRHNFKISNKTTPTLAPGKSSTLTVTFAKAGNFPYSSTVRGDAAKGLKGTFKVTAAPATGNIAAGKSAFSANCGTCHVLKAAATHGTIGPNLDSKPLTLAAITKVVTDGKPGTAMQSYKNILTPTQIQDISAFVYDATH